MRNRATQLILGALLLGVLVGTVCHALADGPADATRIAGYFMVISDLFLRLIKMIIAPLVSSTLIVGIAHMGDSSALGRVGVRTLAWFLPASVISLLLGLLLVNLLQPGAALNLPIPDRDAAAAVAGSAINLRDFITHLVPASFVQALASNEILQIVVFSVFIGVACHAVGEHGKVVAALADSIANVMLAVTSYVMRLAPLGVFAAIAAVVTTQGLAVIATYGKFIASFYFALVVLWAILIGAGWLLVRNDIFRLVRLIRDPMALAFSTSSSEAAYPKTLEQLQRFGISRRIACFVLPVGYSFNLDGSMMYCAFAVIFIAQAYGIDLPWSTQVTMLLLLMITSKGMASVPRASLVVIAATLVSFDLPQGGLLLILAVDQFLDMGRTATNVLGNSIAATAVAKWEGEYTPDKADESST